jgi:DNA topoisomerase IA
MELIITEKMAQMENIADAFKLTEQERIIEITTVSKGVKKITQQKVKFYSGDYNGSEIVILSAKGHIVELRGRSSKKMTELNQIAMFNFTWKAPTKRDKDKYAKFILMKEYFKEADEIIGATDNDEEGELIFWNLVEFFKPTATISRMLYVSMTEKAILDAYTKRGAIRKNIALSSELRSWMDKSYGYVFSKLLTNSFCKVTGDKYIQLSVGRVMTPALSYLVMRMEQIEEAKLKLRDIIPKMEINFGLEAQMPSTNTLNKSIYLDEETDNISMDDAKLLTKKYSNITGEVVKTEKKGYFNKAPSSGITIDDVRDFGYENGIDYTRTDNILEALYLGKYISYPRSESTILPEEEEYHAEILPSCLKYIGIWDYKELIEDLIVREVPLMGEENDEAHFGIHPTGELPVKLPADYQMIYEFIVRTYIKGFCKRRDFDRYICYVEFPLRIKFKKRFSINFDMIFEKLNELENLYDILEENLEWDVESWREGKWTLDAGDIEGIDFQILINYAEISEYLGYAKFLEDKSTYWEIIKDHGYTIIDNIALKNFEEEDESLVPEINIGDTVMTRCSLEKLTTIPSPPKKIDKKELFTFMKDNGLGTDATRSSIMEKLWGLDALTQKQIYPILVRGNPPIPTILGIRIYDAIKQINDKLIKTVLTKEFEVHRDSVKKGTQNPEDIKEQIKKEITAIVQAKMNDRETIGKAIAFFGTCQKCEARMKLVSWKKGDQIMFFLACEKDECKFTAPI